MADALTSCKQVFERMPSTFRKESSKGINAVYQFSLSGEGGGEWHVIVANETCEEKEGVHPSPSITISMSAGDYLDMISNKLNAQVAFMSGRLRISGDMGLALRLQSMFPV